MDLLSSHSWHVTSLGGTSWHNSVTKNLARLSVREEGEGRGRRKGEGDSL